MAIAATVSAFRRIDVLVNNAGYGDVSAVENADLARIEANRKWRELSISTDFGAVGGAIPFPWENK